MSKYQRSSDTEQSLEEQVLKRDSEEDEGEPLFEVPPNLFVPTGSTMLNLAISDSVAKGWPCGRINNLTGDSDTGKTVMGLSCLAEACRLEAFADHKFIYADIEEAIDSSVINMFGKQLRKRITLLSSAAGDDSLKSPETVQELHYQLINHIKAGYPFIYIVDSLDFLPSQEDLDKTEERKVAFEKGKKTSGTYQMTKPKYVKRFLSEIKGSLRGSNSMVLLVRQTIDNINSMFQPKAATGGNAVKFASAVEIWLSQLEVDKTPNKKIIGRKNRCKITKNRITGKKREAHIWLYDSYGIDDTRSCVEFLADEGAIKKKAGWYLWGGEKYQIKDLLRTIESSPKERRRLAARVQLAWDNVENSLKLERMPRYS